MVSFLVSGEESDFYEKVYFEDHSILLHVFIILKCTLLWVQKSNNYYCVIVWPTEVFNYMWSKQKVDKLFSNFVQEQEVKDRYKKILRLSPGVRKVTIKAIRDERHNKN